ncbi:hypothetical protein [Mucilaginibacter paludis]|uniref:Uncharacterized protein n=1 Tax=Mucilaginibacter paludis DSM 18603 TaxID=714943 RepID=H1YF61_9SPHI|nr:hypothetical protein [Mucilaginibacter paludis]EHQ26200.1 hypothetical protein Mucpa_2060 [Mucilaginibacter paludis DSM 18603]
MKDHKDPNVKGRKYHGSPYLKLKKVGQSPRREIKQRLRCAVSFGYAIQFDPAAG